MATTKKPPEPKPEPPAKPIVVAFVSEKRGLTVWDPQHDRAAISFIDGEASTSDPRVIALLDAVPEVSRKEA